MSLFTVTCDPLSSVLTYCKSTLFGHYNLAFGQGGPSWHTLIWLLGGHLKAYIFDFLQKQCNVAHKLVDLQ